MKQSIKSAILLFDIHFPYHNIESLNAVEKFMKDYKWDYLIYGGDQMHFDSISHWKKDKQRQIEGKRLIKEYKGFQRDILNKHCQIVGDKCKKVYILGNHEDWVKDAIDYDPSKEGYYEVENNLKLDKFEIVPFGKIYQLGKLRIMHGFYTAKYHAHKTVADFTRSVMYGHCHTFQTFTKVTPQDVKDFHTGYSVGCLCDMNPDYLDGRPNAWVNGFAIVYLMPDNSYNVYMVSIVNGRFVWNGKLYDGN